MTSPVKVEKSEKAAEAVRKLGGHVPNYRARGEHHYRIPFKDKSGLVSVRPHPDWLKVPEHQTLTQLKAARRAERIPDLSMDVDGDGVVGPTDYFVAKTFAKDLDNRLTTPERSQVVEALENGFLDRYAWGYDQVGAQRKNVLKQLRGKIYNGDNAHELTQVNPHFNSHKVPRFWTASEMKMQRRAEVANAATALKEAHEAQHPWHIPEPTLRQENMLDDPPFTSRHQKAEARRREARQYGGLDAESNAEKQLQVPGLSFVEAPQASTQRELQAQRKQRMLDDLAEAEAKTDFVPPEVRHTRAEYEEHEARRPDPHAMTQNKLFDARKREYMEYNMRHFPHAHKQMPLFSEQEEHWWKMRKTYVAEPWVTSSKKKKPVTGKVTEGAFRQETPEMQDLSIAAGGQAVQGRLERVPRWTQHFLPKGLMAKVPRHFDRLFEGADGVDDGVKQAPELSVDTAPLDSFSSFRVIREASRSLSNSVESEEKASSKKLRSARASTVGRRDSFESGAGARTSRSGSFRRPSQGTGRMTRDLHPTVCLVSALLEDLPMTARVHRRPEELSARPASHPKTELGQSSGRASAQNRLETPDPEPLREQEPLLKVRTGGFQWFDHAKEDTAVSPVAPALPGASASARGSVLAEQR
ncbi:Uncharacterized protein SCF082_LOCUS10406 [Durusdinium trenchii]